jgi:hypothetical protein
MPDNTEIQEVEKDDIHADIAAAMQPEEVKEASAEVVAEPEKTEAPALPPIDAPTAWNAEAKDKFKTLPRDVQELIKSREEEVHKGFTKLDEDRNLGKSMKEVITPYMAAIRAEGGTAETAVKDLLNTAYVLRNAPPQQKAAMVQQIIEQYGVDMSYLQSHQSYQDPVIMQLQQQVQQLSQMANPDVLQKQLQERMENDKLLSEVNAFASNPENIHYEQVKPFMASLLQGGVAKDLKEAYDMACNAHPQIRSTIEAQKAAKLEASKQADLAAKKKAAASVSGSSGNFVPNSKPNTNSVEDDLREAMEAAGL